jgi:hypothetical protein
MQSLPSPPFHLVLSSDFPYPSRNPRLYEPPVDEATVVTSEPVHQGQGGPVYWLSPSVLARAQQKDSSSWHLTRSVPRSLCTAPQFHLLDSARCRSISKDEVSRVLNPKALRSYLPALISCGVLRETWTADIPGKATLEGWWPGIYSEPPSKALQASLGSPREMTHETWKGAGWGKLLHILDFV